MAARAHDPVLLDAVIAGLAPHSGETMIDGTFGAGGYTRALLDAGVRVIAFDRDPDAIAGGQDLVAESGGALTLVHDVYSQMEAALDGAIDGVTLDIGVSSMQLDQAERGFSFQADGPLDMRMGQSGTSAAEFVNEADEAEIADVLFHLGEERQSRRVARAIVAARPITRTGELAAVVRRALGHRDHDKKDPSTRTFQAIRIHVNRELGELEDGLAAAERVLAPGGRLAVVSFHSLEDRIVKRFLKERSGVTAGSRHLPDLTADAPAPSFEAVAKPVRADEAEVARNPRSRSATLRVARRTAAAPQGLRKGRPS
ncbi:16S rRNA (cytosine(1402)-N(4))-methyltransferase RsmH [Sphingomonas nostoxanthinifaciens]|nr:16S rRNA (cytosine(1402)-N(4))-methyltransferase RsmH [Sphingomonas nostoxanthinifaciens]UAK26443.1 16S rRNA (cytosine(1402)-N(4))-methyltransferase RsmH [Sphingomonas nostoxanthinifaciens]